MSIASSTCAPFLDRARSGQGMSLVEATVVLMVVVTLAMTLAPSVGDYLADARNVTAKKDVEAIGSGVLRLVKDTGLRCVVDNGTNGCTQGNRIDLLVSDGADPGSVDTTLAPDVTVPDADALQGGATVNWLPDGDAPPNQDTIDDQLIENDNATPYPSPSFTGGGGPRMKLGWRGAYLNGPIASDPWGTKYQANTLFLAVATNATDGAGSPDNTQEGLREAGWKRNVLVLSSGGNRIVETSFGGAGGVGVSAGGDDVIYVLGGATR